MDVALVYRPEMADYDLGPSHPLRPERFTLAVDLMEAYGLLAEAGAEPTPGHAAVIAPEPAAEEDLLLVHDAGYLETARALSASGRAPIIPRMGLGTGDNPVFRRMYEISALICGAAVLGLREVLGGRFPRTFNVAGGLHHAHRARAAGFCVLNDPAVAIAAALRDRPDLRVCYLDIDAHHGDGVEEAFYPEPRVLTVSLHESGRCLFPGTGFPDETGEGEGAGCALNVPMPPGATDECYRLAFDAAAAPAVRAFAPDVIVAQCGADAHHADPLTHLDMTLPGYRSLVASIRDLADEVCGGRLAASGGGGYGTYSVVPRAWTLVLAELLGVSPAEELPEAWRERSARLSGGSAPETLSAGDRLEVSADRARAVLELTEASVEAVREASPLLAG